MSACCIDYFKVGCFNSCECASTGLVLSEAGVHTVTYWYSNDSSKFKFEYESAGVTELVLPPDIFNPGSPIYFHVLQPSNTFFTITESNFNPINNLTSEVEYQCFWAETKQLILREIGTYCNPDFPNPCGDCGIDHQIAIDQPNISAQLPVGGSFDFTLQFTKESCVEVVQMKSQITTDGGGSPLPTVLSYTPSQDYSSGFSGTVTVPNTAQVGDLFIVVIAFLGYDSRIDCYSDPITTVIIIEVI